MSDAVWVALIAAIPASLAAYGGLIAAHRTGRSGSQNRKMMSKLVKDVEFMKNIMILHVTDQRLHPELLDLGPRQERNKRDG